MRTLLKIALVANLFEWYEFSIYAYLADVIGQVFFNAADSISGLIRSFAVFTIGYFVRPLGSIFFGLLGDRVNRSVSLKLSLMTMAIPTAFIGFLPTYHSVGVLAPGLLILLRVIQGFGMGGELPTNGCYVFEASPDQQRGLLSSAVMVSLALGMLLASLTATLLSWCFDQKMILAWAWRIPFLLSIPLTIGLILIRKSIQALPIHKPRDSVLTLHSLKSSLLAPMLCASFVTVCAFIITTWLPIYLIHFLHNPPRLAKSMHTLVLIVAILFKLAAGYLSRFLSYQRIFKTSLAAMILLIYPLCMGFQSPSLTVKLFAHLLLACLFGSLSGILMEVLANQFVPSVRCLGMNLAYTLPAVLLGSTAPLVNIWMIQKTGLLMFPALYILFFGLLALPAAIRLKVHAH